MNVHIDGESFTLKPITHIGAIGAWGREVETFGLAMQSSGADFGEQEHAYIGALVLSAFHPVPIDTCNAIRAASWDDLNLIVIALDKHFTAYLNIEGVLKHGKV